jgi:hypothetical protein
MPDTQAQAELRRHRIAMRNRDTEHSQFLRQLRQEEREQSRAARAMGRERERAMRRGRGRRDPYSRELDRFATRTSHRATRFFWPNMPFASMTRRLGGDILRGVGVNTHISSILGNVVEQEKLARALSIQAYRPGEKGPAGKRVESRVLQKEAQTTAQELGIDATRVLEAQSRFVAQRGNLAAARRLTPQIMKVARSQGADIADAMFAAAKIESALSSQKGYQGQANQQKLDRTITDTIRLLVGQGKVGSVEMKEAAKELPKVSGIAAMFQGDVAKNIGDLMTVIQLAERGPAKNTMVASMYAQNLALDLSKRSGAFGKAGIDLFDQQGKLRNLQEIIKETLRLTAGTSYKKMKVAETETVVDEQGRVVEQKTGKMIERMVDQTQIQKIQKLMPNKRSFLALQEFINVFQGAGGDIEKGLAAVDAEFKKFGKMVGDAQIEEDLADVMKGTEAKAARFNAQLEKIVAVSADKVIPELERLAPTALKAASALGDLVGWAARNPWTAVSAALAASVARAGIESVFRAAVERVIWGAAARVMPAGGGGGVAYYGAGGGTGGGAAPKRRLGTTAAGALGAVGMGVAVGLPIYTGITMAGQGKIDESEKGLNVMLKTAKGAGTEAESVQNLGAMRERIIALKNEDVALERDVNWWTDLMVGEGSRKWLKDKGVIDWISGVMDPTKEQRGMELRSLESAIPGAKKRLEELRGEQAQQAGPAKVEMDQTPVVEPLQRIQSLLGGELRVRVTNENFGVSNEGRDTPS